MLRIYLSAPNSNPNAIMDAHNKHFRSKWYCHIFADIDHALSSPGIQSAIANNGERHFHDWLMFIRLFNNMNHHRRAVTQHIEYESDVWGYAFQASMAVSKSSRLFTSSYRLTSTTSLIRYILRSLSLINHIPLMAQMKFHTVDIGNKIHRVATSIVASNPMSFHHPLHWFAAGLLKHVNLLGPDAVREAEQEGHNFRQVCAKVMHPLNFLAIMEDPLAGKVVFLAATLLF